MSLILLYIGLVLTPFYEIIIKFLPYATTITQDTRVAKIFIGMVLALAIGIFQIFFTGIKKCENIWPLLFILFIPINIVMAPQFSIGINGVDMTNMWVWKPFCLFLCYFLMFMAIQSFELSRKILTTIFTICSFCAFVMAIYVIIQSFGIDQFFSPIDGKYFDQIPQKNVVGTLGQPTIVSPYIAMIIPMMIYLRRYFFVGVSCLAVILTHSAVAIAAMILSLALYSVFIFKRTAIITLSGFVIICSLVIMT